MTLVYLTAQKYPSKKVEPVYHRSMAAAFASRLGADFSFVVRGEAPPELEPLNPRRWRLPRRCKSLAALAAFPALARAERWSARRAVLYTYDPYLATIAIFWRSLLRLHYRVAFDWHQLFEDWRDAYLARGCDYHLTTSKRLKSLLEERLGVPQERVLAAYGGVDPEPFYKTAATPRGVLRERLGLPEASYLVGYVGGFRSVGLAKGLDVMLSALRLLPADTEMVFVGGSPAEIEESRTLSERLGVGERCFFVAKQPFERVVEYELAMDALCIPYPDLPHFREWGFPLKVWEYMAAGRPIAYSNLPVISEVLEGRATPFVPGSAEALASALRAMHADRAAAEALAAENPAAAGRASWEARAGAILKFLHH